MPGLTIVTTELVLLELADALCQPRQRDEVLALWGVVETDPAFQLVRATRELIQRGRKLYGERADKEWPLLAGRASFSTIPRWARMLTKEVT